jgi:hypothetical protein
MTGVVWRERGDSQRGRPLVLAPADNPGFSESRDYVFECRDRGSSLRIDDEPLRRDDVDENCWHWSPGFFAGEVAGELLAADGTTAGTFLLDVSPNASKMGRDLFRLMVDELWEEDPALVLGTEPATIASGAVGNARSPWIEFARYRAHVPRFLQAAQAVVTTPRRALRVGRVSASGNRVRRVDRRTFGALARSGGLALISGASDVPLDPDARFDVPIPEESLDSSANRTMLAILTGLIRRGRELRDVLQALSEREQVSQTRSSLAARWPVRRHFLESMVVRLERVRRGSPFTEVRRAEMTAAGLTAVAADPLYARAWGCAWRALRHGVNMDDGERLWISPTWEIYESWCFARLARQLREQTPEWTWRRSYDPDRWTGTFAGGIAELELQPRYPATGAEVPKRWSVSGERVPDVVLTVRSGAETRFVVIDAKYRASRPNVLDAMTSAHIYQDSLRHGATRPTASLLMIPAGGGAPWLEDSEFQRAHRVGACVLSPAHQAAMPDLLRQLLPS